jgi:hypothetical protein
VAYGERAKLTAVLDLARVRRLLLLVGLVFAALPVGSVLADTVVGQIGGTGGSCSGPNVWADSSYVVPPGGGTITSFSIAVTAGNANQQVDFLVLRSAAENKYTVVGKTGAKTLAAMPELETFPASVLVQGGDILGFWTPELADCAHPGSGPIIAGSQDDPNVADRVSLDPFTIPLAINLNESAALTTRVGGPPPPTSKGQCKHDGWKDFPQFKNQGDCVSFLAGHGKNQPSG